MRIIKKRNFDSYSNLKVNIEHEFEPSEKGLYELEELLAEYGFDGGSWILTNIYTLCSKEQCSEFMRMLKGDSKLPWTLKDIETTLIKNEDMFYRRLGIEPDQRISDFA